MPEISVLAPTPSFADEPPLVDRRAGAPAGLAALGELIEPVDLVGCDRN